MDQLPENAPGAGQCEIVAVVTFGKLKWRADMLVPVRPEPGTVLDLFPGLTRPLTVALVETTVSRRPDAPKLERPVVHLGRPVVDTADMPTLHAELLANWQSRQTAATLLPRRAHGAASQPPGTVTSRSAQSLN